ncbi:MAG: RagB/SusD family nutrient uptake outer membrane protein [Prevotella sp.]
MKAKYILCGALATASMMFSSCSDFFDQESKHVIFTDDMHIDRASDSIFSLTGIMLKMQALGDRTVLLGEVRGDLVDVTNAANADLRQLAQFNISDDNKYNSPKDYYAVINNCNLYLAKADTAIRNSSNNQLFIKEYAAVKAYRAWTYLQLAINYGKVPFVTEPITTKDQANAQYETKDITDLCNWLVSDIAPYADVAKPSLGDIGITDSRLLYFPIYLLMGDLNLWAGNYKDAALSYYRYITTANGGNSVFPTQSTRCAWVGTNWNSYMNNWSGWFSNERFTDDRENITMIAGDSIPSDGNYSQLRNIYNSSEDNNYKVSLVPSQSLKDLSSSQVYCQVMDNGRDTIYAPSNLSNGRAGDIRLMSCWNSRERVYNGNTVTDQTIYKFMTRNIHIYRRAMVYLRLAEALNRAGYPHFAYEILSEGVNNSVIERDVLPYCTNASDSAFVRQFNFPASTSNGYIVCNVTNTNQNYNTIGLHSRGSGWSQCNKYYLMPDDPTLSGQALLDYQISKVEDMIVDEGALEFAFEGTRYYDLLRVALRRNDPSYLADRIYNRRGADKAAEVRGEIKSDLNDMNNWFLSWGGKIGMR